MLLIALDETVVQHFAFVGLAVAVGVFGVDDSGAGDQNALAPRSDAGGKAQVVEKHGAPCRSGRRRRCLPEQRITPPGLPLPSTPSG